MTSKLDELQLLRRELTTIQKERAELIQQVNHTRNQISSFEQQLYDKEVHIKNIEGFLRQRDEVLAYMKDYMGSSLQELNFLRIMLKT